jgi:hypothetical protein
MSRAEWERLGTVFRPQFDAQTGRMRTVNGRGEIVEQIVSKAEQTRLRQTATRWDGKLMYGAPPQR